MSGPESKWTPGMWVCAVMIGVFSVLYMLTREQLDLAVIVMFYVAYQHEHTRDVISRARPPNAVPKPPKEFNN